MTTDPPDNGGEKAPEEVLARTFKEIFEKLNPQRQKALLRELVEALMAPLSKVEKENAKANVMEQVLAGLFTGAAGNAQEAVAAVQGLMGGMGSLFGAFLGGSDLWDSTGSTEEMDGEQEEEGDGERKAEDEGEAGEEAKTDEAEGTEEDLDFSGLIDQLMESAEDMLGQIVPMVGAVLKLVLSKMKPERAKEVGRQWAAALRQVLGQMGTPDYWEQLMDDFLASLKTKGEASKD